MHERAIRGVLWTLFSYSGSKVIAVLGTVVLARIVAPAEFGLLAVATLATNFLNWIADMGFSSALVVRQDLDERGQGTLLTMMIASGFAAALIAVALAPLAAAVFHQPRLVGVLAAIAALLPLGSIAGFWEAVLLREFEFRRRFYGLLIQSATTAGVSIALAATVRDGVWALVFGQIAGMAAFGLVLFLVAPYHVRPALDRAAAARAFASGRGFLGQGMAMYVRQNVDTFAAGAAFGTRRVGFYSMANRLGDLVYWTIAHPVANVTFPSFAKSRAAGDDIRGSFLNVLGLVAFVSCPVGLLMSAAARPFTLAVFGDRWIPMIHPLMVMGLWAGIRQIDQTIGWLLNAVDRAGLLGWLSLFNLVPLTVGCIVATQLGGLTAVALVPLGDTILSAVISSMLIRRHVDVSFRSQLVALRPSLVASVPAWFGTWGVTRLLGSSDPWLTLAACLVCGILVYGLVIAALEPGRLGQARDHLARILGRSTAPASA